MLQEPPKSTPAPGVKREYPHPAQLGDGARITLRLMRPADTARMLAFARALPEEDLLFLRSDICDPAVVEARAQNVAGGRTIRVLAEASGEVAGYSSLHLSGVTSWVWKHD